MGTLELITELMQKYEQKKWQLIRNPSMSIGEMHALDRQTLLDIRKILKEKEYEEES